MDWLRTRAYRLLRWSEKYIKTDMVYAASGGFWLFFGQAAAAVFSLVLAIAFANLIEPEKYGNYKYVLSLAGIIGALTLTGLGTAVTRAVARGHEGTLRYAFRLMLIWSIGMVALSAAAGSYYLFKDNIFLGLSLFIIGATSPIIAAASLYRPFLMGKREFRKVAIFGILQGGLPTLSVLIALVLHAPLLALVAVYFIVNAVTVWLLYTRAATHAKNNETDPITNHLGKHLSVMGIVAAVAGKLDSILIFQLLGGAELAIFSLATTIPDTIRGSLKNITALATPKFAKMSKEEMREAVWSKTKLVFFGIAAVTIAYIIAAPYLFKFLFPLYIESTIYSQVYALTLLASLVMASAYLDAQVAVKERYILNISNNTITIVSVVVGIYFFGIWGAIFARLFARVTNALLSAFIIAKH
jgi:O-antigen/teichoic acid export membrane protein